MVTTSLHVGSLLVLGHQLEGAGAEVVSGVVAGILADIEAVGAQLRSLGSLVDKAVILGSIVALHSAGDQTSTALSLSRLRSSSRNTVRLSLSINTASVARVSEAQRSVGTAVFVGRVVAVDGMARFQVGCADLRSRGVGSSTSGAVGRVICSISASSGCGLIAGGSVVAAELR